MNDSQLKAWSNLFIYCFNGWKVWAYQSRDQTKGFHFSNKSLPVETISNLIILQLKLLCERTLWRSKNTSIIPWFTVISCVNLYVKKLTFWTVWYDSWPTVVIQLIVNYCFNTSIYLLLLHPVHCVLTGWKASSSS